MAKGVTIKIDGLEQLKKQLGKFPEHLTDQVDLELSLAAKHMEDLAVQSAQTQGIYDTGRLLGEISHKPIKKLEHEVVSGMYYSAYHEWGTITLVKVPAELQAYAAQFKGKGIKKTGGIKPRPFFFVQIPFVEKFLNQNLKDTVAKALSK